jgi:hypothetical protein
MDGRDSGTPSGTGVACVVVTCALDMTTYPAQATGDAYGLCRAVSSA